MRVEAVAMAKNTKSAVTKNLGTSVVNIYIINTYMFPRQLEPIQDEKCQRRLPISGQYPDKTDEDYPRPLKYYEGPYKSHRQTDRPYTDHGQPAIDPGRKQASAR